MRLSSFATIVAISIIPSFAIAQTAAPAAPATSAAPSENRGGPQDAEARVRFEKFRAACGADLDKHCGTIQRDQTKESRNGLRQCIETHKAKFSTACQTAVTERDAAREARKQANPAHAEKPKS